MSRIAWIGLGVMGYPMAGHLKTKGGHDVVVYNRTSAVAEKWLSDYGGECAESPAKAARGADFAFTSVGNDQDLESVTLGDHGLFKTLPEGAILIDHTTASAEIARKLSILAEERKCGFLDAPVSGGEAGAQSGTLTVMTGGRQEIFERAEPLIQNYARATTLIGPAGAGQLTKMVNQICIAGLIESLAEGLHFAKQAGLDVQTVMETISKGAAQSWQMENRWQTMADGAFEFGFAVDWMRKDLAICLQEAARNGTDLPVAKLIDGYYAEIQEIGGGRWDTSSLITRFDKHKRR